MERSRVLVIEDNPDTRRFLEAMLGKDYQVTSAENGVIGIELARKIVPDIILLDVMLPILSGYDTCSLIRKDERTKHIPIIFLSAKNTVTDITQGLGNGADDYLPKPFDYKELVARIHTRLRQAKEGKSEVIQAGDLKITPSSRTVEFKGKPILLTLTEFNILKMLASDPGEVVSRERILEEVWQEQAKKANDRTIDVHIRAIRKKIPEINKFIISVYGVGYKFEI
ncbi:MAG: DNA-binding response regulator [Bdellovibrionaceae bacterium]|nr:DNA-binding response regulator [Pseudobdellovibrionaceae bacterium]